MPEYAHERAETRSTVTIDGVQIDGRRRTTRIIEAAEARRASASRITAITRRCRRRQCAACAWSRWRARPSCSRRASRPSRKVRSSDRERHSAREARQGTLEFYLVEPSARLPGLRHSRASASCRTTCTRKAASTAARCEPKRVLGQDDFGGDILYDGDRCIMCTRCVRFMREIAAGRRAVRRAARPSLGHRHVLRGRASRATSWAGNIVDICPVGALLSKDFLHKARVWDLDSTPSICPNCSQGCNITIDTRDNLVQRLRAAPEPRRQLVLDVRLRPLRLRVVSTSARTAVRERRSCAQRAPRRAAASRLAAARSSRWWSELGARAGHRRVTVVGSPFHVERGQRPARAPRHGARRRATLGVPLARARRTRVVCPGFPTLARRRDLAANVRGLEMLGFKRVGDDDGDGRADGTGGSVLIVIGDELADQPAGLRQRCATVHRDLGHTPTAAPRATRTSCCRSRRSPSRKARSRTSTAACSASGRRCRRRRSRVPHGRCSACCSPGSVTATGAGDAPANAFLRARRHERRVRAA